MKLSALLLVFIKISSFYIGALKRNKKRDECFHTLTLCMYLMFLYLLLCCTISQVLPENTEVEFIPTAAVVVDERIEELMVKSKSTLIQERQDLAEKTGQVISLLDDEVVPVVVVVADEEEIDKENDVVIPTVDVSSFEEIRSAIGFSPLNDTVDSVPHDEDLLSWSLRSSPHPSRCSIYDPIQIN